MQEMDLAAKLQKVSRLDARALTAAQALEMATIGGARALHMEDQIGSLETGKQADIILLRTDVAHGLPIYDIPGEITYSLKASDVQTVIVAGRVLMRDRTVLTLDPPSILAKGKEYGEKVRQSLAKPN
jgi:5-methylthioadenosine/S-adenosylhomocysteine deaminase